MKIILDTRFDLDTFNNFIANHLKVNSVIPAWMEERRLSVLTGEILGQEFDLHQYHRRNLVEPVVSVLKRRLGENF
jgi:hypothetical protein